MSPHDAGARSADHPRHLQGVSVYRDAERTCAVAIACGVPLPFRAATIANRETDDHSDDYRQEMRVRTDAIGKGRRA